jgi:hypothetical protein
VCRVKQEYQAFRGPWGPRDLPGREGRWDRWDPQASRDFRASLGRQVLPDPPAYPGCLAKRGLRELLDSRDLKGLRGLPD